MSNMSLQPLWPTRPQAIQVDLTMTRELLRVLSRGGNGHPLHHDSLYQSIYLSSAMASQLRYDWPVLQARALAPLFLSLKQRYELQARHYRAWRMLVTEGLATEEAIRLPIDERSSVNKPAVWRLLDRLSAFPKFGAVDILEVGGFKCQCWNCSKMALALEQERGDVFVQPGYWFAAVVLRSNCDIESVMEALKTWGGFGEWDAGHRCYVPDEKLNEERIYVEEIKKEEDSLERGNIGILFGEEIEEAEEEAEEEDENDVEHTEDIDDLSRLQTEIDSEGESSTGIETPPSTTEELVDPTLTLSPIPSPTDPCPEHCPSRRRRLRDDIHNPKYPSCRYHCHNPHAPFEFEPSGEQVGFWLPHGLQDEQARKEWAAATNKRMRDFRMAWKSLFGNDCAGVKATIEVQRCAWNFVRADYGYDERRR